MRSLLKRLIWWRPKKEVKLPVDKCGSGCGVRAEFTVPDDFPVIDKYKGMKICGVCNSKYYGSRGIPINE